MKKKPIFEKQDDSLNQQQFALGMRQTDINALNILQSSKTNFYEEIAKSKDNLQNYHNKEYISKQKELIEKYNMQEMKKSVIKEQNNNLEKNKNPNQIIHNIHTIYKNKQQTNNQNNLPLKQTPYIQNYYQNEQQFEINKNEQQDFQKKQINSYVQNDEIGNEKNNILYQNFKSKKNYIQQEQHFQNDNHQSNEVSDADEPCINQQQNQRIYNNQNKIQNGQEYYNNNDFYEETKKPYQQGIINYNVPQQQIHHKPLFYMTESKNIKKEAVEEFEDYSSEGLNNNKNYKENYNQVNYTNNDQNNNYNNNNNLQNINYHIVKSQNYTQKYDLDSDNLNQNQQKNLSDSLYQEEQSKVKYQDFNLFEEFFLITADQMQCRKDIVKTNESYFLDPVTLFSYPAIKNQKDCQKRNVVPKFAFPFGVEVQKRKKTDSLSELNQIIFGGTQVERYKNCFVFAIKSDESFMKKKNLQHLPPLLTKVNPTSLLYCISVTTKDFLQEGEQNDDENMKGHGKDSTYFTTIEEEIKKILKTVYEMPLPQFDSIVNMKVPEDDPLYLSIPKEEDCSNIEAEWGMCLALNNMGVVEYTYILCSLLLEQSVVFFSTNRALLTATILLFHSALKPFIWPHPLLFTVSDDLLHIFDSPVPIICGLHKDYTYAKEKEMLQEYDHIAFINLDQFAIDNQNKQIFKYDFYDKMANLLDPIFKEYKQSILQYKNLNLNIFQISDKLLDHRAIQDKIQQNGVKDQFLEQFFGTQMFTYFVEEFYNF